MDNDNKPKCNNCGSGQVYSRISTDEWVCRLCGHIEKKKEVKKK